MSVDEVQGVDVSAYDTDGYLHLPGYVTDPWLSELQQVAAAFVDESRTVESSNSRFDVEDGHCAESPRLRRLNSPVDQHDTFARFALEGPAAQLAVQVLGGPVRYHHSKLNFKWSDGGEAVEWHQDIQFWPHTDFSPLTIGVYLDDIDAEMGPMGVLPGSHLGTLYNLYRQDGSWGGAMNDSDIAALSMDEMVWLDGPAGSVTVHNCCLVHGSVANTSPRPRPLLLQTYSRADSYPILGIGANGVTGKRSGTVIGGEAQQSVTVDGRVIPGAPDWSQRGAPTIFGSQNAT
ncbi:MAG: phytanoyl-CoA dioxygenase family protein [Ilumatobacteraceae bacterium]